MTSAAGDRADWVIGERQEERDRRRTAERLTIARELHDTLAHTLVAINVRAAASAHLGGDDAATALLDIKNESARDFATYAPRLRSSETDSSLRIPGHPLDPHAVWTPTSGVERFQLLARRCLPSRSPPEPESG